MTWLTALPPLCLVFLFFLNLLPHRHWGLAIIAGLIGTGVFAVLQIQDACARVNFQEQQSKLLAQQTAVFWIDQIEKEAGADPNVPD